MVNQASNDIYFSCFQHLHPYLPDSKYTPIRIMPAIRLASLTVETKGISLASTRKRTHEYSIFTAQSQAISGASVQTQHRRRYHQVMKIHCYRIEENGSLASLAGSLLWIFKRKGWFE
jgi:hypothetical protein